MVSKRAGRTFSVDLGDEQLLTDLKDLANNRKKDLTEFVKDLVKREVIRCKPELDKTKEAREAAAESDRLQQEQEGIDSKENGDEQQTQRA